MVAGKSCIRPAKWAIVEYLGIFTHFGQQMGLLTIG